MAQTKQQQSNTTNTSNKTKSAGQKKVITPTNKKESRTQTKHETQFYKPNKNNLKFYYCSQTSSSLHPEIF